MNEVTKEVDATKPIPMPRPVVTLGYAQTPDGCLATSTGSSRWISAPESLRFPHGLRAEHPETPSAVEGREYLGCVTVS